jgi:hypothetical protein
VREQSGKMVTMAPEHRRGREQEEILVIYCNCTERLILTDFPGRTFIIFFLQMQTLIRAEGGQLICSSF